MSCEGDREFIFDLNKTPPKSFEADSDNPNHDDVEVSSTIVTGYFTSINYSEKLVQVSVCAINYFPKFIHR